MNPTTQPLVIAPGNYQTSGNPRIIPFVCQDSLATVTTAGFINGKTSQKIYPTDVFLIAYDEDISFFNTSIDSSGAITLSVNIDIPDGSITTAKLADQAVTFAKLAPGSVLTSVLANVAVDATKLDANAVTTVKILDANVTLAKLATGVRPLLLTKFGGKHSAAGGSATVSFSAPGVLAIHILKAFIESSANAVSIQKVTPSADTVTLLCSGDPGACVISWEADDAAA